MYVYIYIYGGAVSIIQFLPITSAPPCNFNVNVLSSLKRFFVMCFCMVSIISSRMYWCFCCLSAYHHRTCCHLHSVNLLLLSTNEATPPSFMISKELPYCIESRQKCFLEFWLWEINLLQKLNWIIRHIFMIGTIPHQTPTYPCSPHQHFNFFILLFFLPEIGKVSVEFIIFGLWFPIPL